MDPKYSNIFWHQGVKLFEEKLLKTESGRLRIDHLENDITKALLNLFEHCSYGVLKSFLSLMKIKDAPSSFEFDFQVTDTKKYRQHRKKIMLCIISDYTQQKSNGSYSSKISIPDACIFNSDTAVLIEAKTQSPLIEEQIDSHIKNYLGTATTRITITWEQISERLKNIGTNLKPLDTLLINHFCQLLELVGIAEFNGFQNSDFSMLGSIGRVSNDEFIDFRRILDRKIDKFMSQLKDHLEPEFSFKKFGIHTGKVSLSPAAWSSFYFYDSDPTKIIGEYPKLNIDWNEHGMELSVNAEVKSTLNAFLNRIRQKPSEFEHNSANIDEFNFLLFYKLQYFPQNNFLWNLVPGLPKKMGEFTTDEIFSVITAFKNDWENFRTTLLFEMKSGIQKHPSGRPFNEKEINYADTKNPNPHFAVRIEKRYPADSIDNLGKNVTIFFKKEIRKLKNLLMFLTNK